MTAKYPKTIIDESSGLEVPSVLYEAHQEGMRKVIDYLCEANNGLSISISGDKWGKKLKEWSIE